MISILITITVCALSFAAYIYISHDKIAQRKAESYLAKWKVKEEKKIREDAYSRSRAVSFGKTIEHYVPFMENFPVEPKDVKCSVHFIEVKSGNSNLNSHQKNIKDAILKGRVHWHEFTVDGIWEHETRKQHLNTDKDE